MCPLENEEIPPKGPKLQTGSGLDPQIVRLHLPWPFSLPYYTLLSVPFHLGNPCIHDQQCIDGTFSLPGGWKVVAGVY